MGGGGGGGGGRRPVGATKKRDPPRHQFAAPPSDWGGSHRAGGGGVASKNFAWGKGWVRGKEARSGSACSRRFSAGSRGEYIKKLICISKHLSTFHGYTMPWLVLHQNLALVCRQFSRHFISHCTKAGLWGYLCFPLVGLCGLKRITCTNMRGLRATLEPSTPNPSLNQANLQRQEASPAQPPKTPKARRAVLLADSPQGSGLRAFRV